MNVRIMLLCAFSIFSLVDTSESTSLEVEVIKEACPGEGCTYDGLRRAVKAAPVYSQPDKNARTIATLRPGEPLRLVTGEVHIVPGMARVIGRLPRKAQDINPREPILILDYLGEGYSRTRQGDKYFRVKIARSKDRCERRPQRRYCWVDVIREPISEWWVSITARDAELHGWVLMDDGPIARVVPSH